MFQVYNFQTTYDIYLRAAFHNFFNDLIKIVLSKICLPTLPHLFIVVLKLCTYLLKFPEIYILAWVYFTFFDHPITFEFVTLGTILYLPLK